MLAAREASLQSAPDLRAAFLPVPGGSATLLLTPAGHVVLIGGGKDLTVFEEMGEILPFRKRTIDLLILPDARTVSLATLAEVTERYTVTQALLPSDLPKTLEPHRDLLADQNIPIRDAAWDDPLTITEGVTLLMTYRGKSKHAITTIETDSMRIESPGSAEDLDDDIKASVLRGIIWNGDAIAQVVTYDMKEERTLKGISVHNLVKKGRFLLSIP